MCYILYGSMDKSVNSDDYSKALEKSKYKLALGTKHDVKMCIINDSGNYRITNWVCDCEFPVGKHNKDATEIKELASLINDLKNAKDSKCIYIALAWAGKKVKAEKSVNFSEINIISFLADMENDCLYKINFS